MHIHFMHVHICRNLNSIILVYYCVRAFAHVRVRVLVCACATVSFSSITRRQDPSPEYSVMHNLPRPFPLVFCYA